MFDSDILAFIHEPARLHLLLCLNSVREVDFTFLLNATRMSKGNISIQMSKLSDQGLVIIRKFIENNKSRTLYCISRTGRNQLITYKSAMLSLLKEV